jgi:hypothetical protein
LVVRAEAASQDALGRIKQAIADALARHPEAGPITW